MQSNTSKVHIAQKSANEYFKVNIAQKYAIEYFKVHIDTRFHLKLTENVNQGEPKGAKSEPRGAKREPMGTKREPKGGMREPNKANSSPKCDQHGIENSTFEKGRRQDAPGQSGCSPCGTFSTISNVKKGNIGAILEPFSIPKTIQKRGRNRDPKK